MPRKRPTKAPRGHAVSRSAHRNLSGQELRKANKELGAQVRELRNHQSALEQSRAEYVDLFDFAPVTYALLDTVGIVLQVNPAACRLLNVERRYLVGHPLLTFVVEQDRREFLEHLRRCRVGKRMVESEVRLTSRGGPAVTCRLFSKRASSANGEKLPTVIIDQTEHVRLDQARLSAERRREHAERAAEIARAESAAKDRFLNTVSHELRTPLTPALFAASRLAAWDGLPGDAKRLATTVKRNIEFEARLIDDLLDVARINRNRVSLRLTGVDVHQVVHEAVATCGSLARAKGIAVVVNLIAAVHHVTADRARLRQVFWNLLTNAIKFTEAPGTVTITSSNVAERILRVSVRDTGIGMDSRVQEKLFAPFDGQPTVDARSTNRDSRAGLGLGLAICKGIVGAHGGQIWAMSEGPGRGSTFAVELATTQPQERAETRRPHTERDDMPKTSRPLRVLVVEDDVDSCEMLALFLSHHGHDVEIASSLGAAISRLDESWDVVLSDIGLPDGSGLELAKRARQAPQPPQKLIAFTGYGSNEDISASKEAGFDDHVVKPIDLERLLDTLTLPTTAR